MKMKTLKYRIIKCQEQYQDYCNCLESLMEGDGKDAETIDEIELLNFLIEKWESDNSSLHDSDPVEVLKYLMNEKNMKAQDLVAILGVSKGLISDIMNYKKGFSKDVIRQLSTYFKVSQELFNRPYPLKSVANRLQQKGGKVVA
jgi:HTH-type transcriptional regulator/antitoxin HigA